MYLSWTDKNTLHVRVTMHKTDGTPCSWETALGFGDEHDPARYSVPNPTSPANPLRATIVNGSFDKDIDFSKYAYSKATLTLPDNSPMIKPIPPRLGTPESAPLGTPAPTTAIGPNHLEFTLFPVGNSWKIEGFVGTSKGPAKKHRVTLHGAGGTPKPATTNDVGHFSTTVPVAKNCKVLVTAGGQLTFGDIPLAAAAPSEPTINLNVHWFARVAMPVFVLATLFCFGWSVKSLIFSSPAPTVQEQQSQTKEGAWQKHERELAEQRRGGPAPTTITESPNNASESSSSEDEGTGLLSMFAPVLFFLFFLVATIVTFVVTQKDFAIQGFKRLFHKYEAHAYGERKSHNHLVLIAADGKVTRETDGVPVDPTGKPVKPADITTTTTTPTQPGGASQTSQTASQPDATRQVVKAFVVAEILEAFFPPAAKVFHWLMRKLGK
jgi:hypothetical protein